MASVASWSSDFGTTLTSGEELWKQHNVHQIMKLELWGKHANFGNLWWHQAITWNHIWFPCYQGSSSQSDKHSMFMKSTAMMSQQITIFKIAATSQKLIYPCHFPGGLVWQHISISPLVCLAAAIDKGCQRKPVWTSQTWRCSTGLGSWKGKKMASRAWIDNYINSFLWNIITHSCAGSY